MKAISAMILLLSATAAAAATSAANTGAAVSKVAPAVIESCGPIRAVSDLGGIMDYRNRFNDSRVKSGLAQVDRYHTELARSNALVNPADRRIIADLDFTLRYSPNHLEALRMLLAYVKAGGQQYEYYSTECYLDWAQRFAPDDVSVLQLEAQYFSKSGRADKAEQLYRTALLADPKSRELHYQVGLFYAGRKQYAEAREHALIAYKGGYPLPGLRNMLQRAGQWSAADTSAVAKP